MKHTIFTLLLLCAGLLQAQEFSYTITPTGSTFTLDLITENSENRFQIDRTTGLDTTILQSILYSKIEQSYQEQAKLEAQIILKQREAVAMLKLLNDNNLNAYVLHQRAKQDSTYINERGWLLRNSNGLDIELSTIYREGNTTLLRDSSNTNYGVILPKSPNYIELLFLSDDSRVELFSNNGRLYRGELDGVRYLFRKK